MAPALLEPFFLRQVAFSKRVENTLIGSSLQRVGAASFRERLPVADGLKRVANLSGCFERAVP